MDLRSLAVFCSASPNAPGWLTEEAVAIGKGIAQRGLRLIYGGASVGAMGMLADAALAGSAQVVGVIPKALVGREAAHQGVTELKIVETMHERKAEMFRLADAFVFLPGGFGTIEEFFEMLTWKQLGIHSKPIVFVNLHGYYDPLLAQFEKGIAEGIISSQCRVLYAIADDSEKVFALLGDATVLNRAPGKWY